MGLFKSLKGKANYGTDNTAAPAPPSYESTSNHQNHSGPTNDNYDSMTTKSEKRGLFSSHHGRSSSTTTATPDPPLAQQQSSKNENAYFAPPPGPPPTQRSSHHQQEPPRENPPPYHDWTVIPDTSLLPPPPALPNEFSPTNNASWDSAAAAHAWCDRNPPYTPSIPHRGLLDAVASGQMMMRAPPGFRGSLSPINPGHGGKWRIKSSPGQDDAFFHTTLPAYFAASEMHHPLKTERRKVVYFEVAIQGLRDRNSGVAVGFAGLPYPPWRLPGWHRSSLGVHGDDGRRFVNDSFGGRDFVSEFKVGEVVGVGMRFEVEPVRSMPGQNSAVGAGGAEKVKTRVFFTRNGREEAGWDVDEERDAERDEGIDGLQGEMDLYPAVGVFGGVQIEVNFVEAEWLFKPV